VAKPEYMYMNICTLNMRESIYVYISLYTYIEIVHIRMYEHICIYTYIEIVYIHYKYTHICIPRAAETPDPEELPEGS
jgi:hypothetical protein